MALSDPAIAVRIYWPICFAVPSAVFRAMLPLNPSVTTTSTVPFADIVALDEAAVFERRQVRLAQHPRRRLDLLQPLDLLDTDIEQTDRRALDIEDDPRHRRAHDGEIDEERASVPIVAPTSSTIERPRVVGQIAAMAGRSMCGMVRRQTFAIAIKAPVLPAETATSASPFLTASIAIHIDDVRRPERRAWLGLSSIFTATSV